MTFYDVAKGIVWVLLRTIWRLRVSGAQHVPRSGAVILASNHVSYFDPPALGCAAPRRLRYMAKEELFRIPVLGPLIRALGAYPVDRKRGDVAAIKRSLEMLARGEAIVVFPEGTRNFEGTGKAQAGIGFLHHLSGAPIVPAYVAGTVDAGRLRPMSVVFGPPLRFTTGGKASRAEMAKWTDEIMSAIFQLREAPGGD